MTVKDLLGVLDTCYGYVGNANIKVYDKTGNVDFGVFDTEDILPSWLCFVEVKRVVSLSNSLSVRLEDFTGDLITRNDDIDAFVLGFDYEKDPDFYGKYYPSYINIKVNEIAGCKESVKKLKVNPDDFGGYSFKLFGKKYTMRDVIRR